MSTKLENELRLLEQYTDELSSLRIKLFDADINSSGPVQKELIRKLEIFEKQVFFSQS